MKTQALNKNLNALNPAAEGAALLHEQLALKRLKELEAARPRAGRAPARWHELARRLVRAAALGLAAFWTALMRQPVLARHVEPGQLPAEWHELEHARQLRALRLM
jgi:hypothetical protein